MPLAPDARAAADFLARLYPNSPWVVTAIFPDAGNDPEKIDNRIFGVASRGGFEAWLDERNALGWNAYYSVNEVAPGVRRAHKTDIVCVRYLHVDLDPRVWDKSEDEAFQQHKDEKRGYIDFLDRERERIAAALRCPPNNIPVPTAAISSGGGCNALWRLAEPIRLDRTVEKAEEVERYNIALVTAFNENNCHDVSRILRMPHTVNWPNKTKRDKGRMPALSSILWESAEAYPLGLFRQVEPRQTNGVGSGRGRPKTMVPGSVQPITDIAEIRQYAKQKERITDAFLNIVKLGVQAPEAEKFAGDNSKLILYVAGELMRAGVPDPQIFAVITEPSFACSYHALKHRGGARRAAQRALDRARDTQGPNGDVLLELNDQFFVAGDWGGKCVVVQETEDPVTNRKELRLQSPDHFFNRFAHRSVEMPLPENSKKKIPDKVPLGKWWFTNPRSRRVDRVAFAPGRELADNVYNLWQGFAVDPVPGDKHLPYLEHLRIAVCDENEVNYRYLLGWMADAVQNPSSPAESAVVLRGGQGKGKGTVCHYFGRLWGRHYMPIAQGKHLTGNFNNHLADLVVLFADEAVFAGDKEGANVLKALITESHLAIERKGYDVEQGVNHLHIIMATNASWVVQVESDDRRYFVLDLPKVPSTSTDFTALRHSMDLVEEGGEGGLCNLLYFLQTYDLSKFDKRNPPKTAGHTTQKLLSLSPDHDWWHDKLSQGRMTNKRRWRDPVPTDEVWNDYSRHAKTLNRGVQGKGVLGKILRDLVPGIRIVRLGVKVWNEETRCEESVRTQCYEFPPLDDCRRAWDAKMGTTTAWEEIEPDTF